MNRKANRLINEKSPYLLQHAHNPVDWYPWGDEAFERARNEQKPVFLSVGYSTCHWCHVMERESFENAEIAALLNEKFVAVKVDREERPEVDRVYMTALQAMGQNGGWPMSMFLTPDLQPFYGGTYFPPEDRYGRAGFPGILLRVYAVWDREREKVMESARGITDFLKEAASGGIQKGDPGGPVLDECLEQFRRTYDPVSGGFGNGPKFPRPAAFLFLLRHSHRSRNPSGLEMTAHTLRKMALGGIRDHVGGGFHRYAVDAEWRVPHFEKMLYDQAQLLDSYVDLFRLTGDSFFAGVASDTAEYVLRDLRHHEGGFASAEDADSARHDDTGESGEGAFYVWTREEIVNLLGRDADVVSLRYGVEERGNAPLDPQHEFEGQNILFVARSVDDTAHATGRTPEDVRKVLARARGIMLEARSRRPRPHRDEKVLTGWNGLMIGALCRAGAVLGRPEWVAAAAGAARFVTTRLRDQESGALLRRYSDGEARFDAQLDDHAFLVHGLLELFTYQGDSLWLREAVGLTDRLETVFRDPAGGGYFDSPGNDKTIIVRMKEMYDGAEPTGNGVAALNLIRLAGITGEGKWDRLARATVQAFGGTLSARPVAVPAMAAALSDLLHPAEQVVVADAGDGNVAGLLAEVHKRFLPGSAVVTVRAGDETIRALSPKAAAFGPVDGKTAAWVCRDFVCTLPVTDSQPLARILERTP